MPKSNETINQELYDLLDTKGFDPETYDSSGKAVPTPEDAEIMQFHFYHDGEDHGTVTVTIDGLKQMQVYFNDEITENMSALREDGEENSWTSLLKQLKKFATKRQLGFQVRNVDKLGADMRRRNAQKKLDEGYYGTRRTSFSDNTPKDVKLVIKHNKQLEEGDKRFRYIERIFVENAVGERLLCPTVKPSEGRVFARHIVEGGQYRDERWNHIAEICEDIRNLGGFVRATRTKQFNESVNHIVESAQNHYTQLRETMNRLQTGRGYNNYFENWQPMLTETEGDLDFAGMFSQKTVDPRIERAFPVLQKMGIQIREMTEVNEFESWAENVIREELDPVTGRQVDDLIELLGKDSSSLPVGADASNAIGELEGIIDNEQLNTELRHAAQADPDNDARPVIMGWLEKNRDDPVYDNILDRLDLAEPEPTSAPASPVSMPPVKAKAPLKTKPLMPPLPDAKEKKLPESEMLERMLKLVDYRG